MAHFFDPPVNGYLKGNELIQEAINKQVNVFMLTVDDISIDKIIRKLQPEQAQTFHLLGGDAMYEPSLLTDNIIRFRNMIIAVPWHLSNDWKTSKEFVKTSDRLWCQSANGEEKITWRRATTYDATNVLIEALKSNPSRAGVQQFLKQHLTTPTKFSFEGVTGTIKFTKEGDIDRETQLVKICEELGPKYVFKRLKDSSESPDPCKNSN